VSDAEPAEPAPASTAPHVDPSHEQIQAVATDGRDGPVVMLNLNRYTGGDRGEYLRYGEVAMKAIEAVGGRILWAAPVEQVVIGCDHEAYDEVIAVWYPSRSAFLGLMEFPGYLEATEHRRAGLDQAALLALDPASLT
jgi:uncharacterized protein (DUF1330 family)